LQDGGHDIISRRNLPATALSSNDLGQVVHTNVPLFTKQYKLVPCEGFHVNVPVCGSHGMKSNEQGEYCRSGSAVIVIALGRFAKNRYINYLLYFLLLHPSGVSK